MNRKYGIGAVTTGSNNWQPRRQTAWQRERMTSELLPIQHPKPSFWNRVFGR